MQDCSDMVLFFNNSIQDLLNQYLPTYTVKRHSTDKPWVNDEFRRFVRIRQYAFRHGDLDKYKFYRNKVQRCAKSLRKKYYENKVADLRRADPRNWWSRVKNITGMSSAGNGALTGLANKTYDGDMDKLANEINKFFHTVSRDLLPLKSEILETIPIEQSNVPPIIIDQEQVERRLLSTSVFKSPGPDGIPNWILHDLAPFISKPVTAIFNASIADGVVPDVWKQSNVVPVPKSNPPRTIEDDLRPISLTPTLAKHLEWFVGQELLSVVSDKLDAQQFGALKGRSTTHALVDIVHNWNAALDAGSSVRAVFVDYAKAFDHVDHSILLCKLISMGVPAFIIKWIYSFLDKRQQRVKIGNIFSNWLRLNGGMPQGTWLGPLTFVILIDGLRLDCLLHKFVDDTTASEILKKNQSSNMVNIVQQLIRWSESNNMNINSKKTKKLSWEHWTRTHHPCYWWMNRASSAYHHSSCWVWSSHPLWNGTTMLQRSAQRQHQGCISWNSSDVRASTRRTLWAFIQQ